MKKLLCLALVAVMALSCAALPAMADSHPLIYKVTDAEGHYVYLMGTMHVASQDTFPIAKLDEVMGLADTIGVIYNGQLLKIADAASLTSQDVGRYMMGVA